MGKRRDLSLEQYIEETTKNIKEDRAMAKTLLIDVMADMAASATDRTLIVECESNRNS